MTVELGTKTQQFALALMLLAGCAAQPESKPSSNAQTPMQTPIVSVHDTQGGEAPVEPARQTQDLSGTAHSRAREIYLRALDIFDQRDYDLAYLEFGRALDVDPTFYMAWFKKGLCQYYKQKYDLEIDCYRRCLEIAPDYTPALLNLGNALLAQDRLEESVRVYRKILAQEGNSKHQIALYNLGLIYFDLQDYHSSIQHLQQFIDAYPTDPSRPKAELLIKRARQKLDAQR